MREKKILFNYLSYIFVGFLICFIGITNVFGATYTNIGNYVNTTVMLVSSDMNQNSPITVNPNTTYSLGGVREVNYIIGGYNFQANTNYQLESHLLYQTFEKANKYSVSGYNGETCLISYDNSWLTGSYPRWAFECPNPTNSVTITIWNDNIVPGGQFDTLWSGTNNFAWGTALLKSSPDRLSGSLSDSDNIINNQNQNTQNIINNQNQNTQDIIKSNQVCKVYDDVYIDSDGYYLNSSGIPQSNSNFAISKYIPIDNNSSISMSYATSEGDYACFYDSNKTVISCIKQNTQSLNTSISIPSNSVYFRFSLRKSENKPRYEICINGNQVITDSIDENTKTNKGILGKLKDIFNTLFSDDDADVSALNNMVGWLPAGPVDSIINLPLSLFNALTNTLSGTCQDITLTLPFVNTTFTLPCFDSFMSQYLSGFSTLWALIGTIASVFILYNYLLSLYKWIDDTLTLRENNLPGYYDDNWGGGA